MALDACHERPEGGGRLGREVAERIDVLAARQPDVAGHAAPDRWMEAEVLVRPDGRRRETRAEAARLAARRLGVDPLAGLADGQRPGVGGCIVSPFA
jgi:hypothetical protein